jgi:hypothetical protein
VLMRFEWRLDERDEDDWLFAGMGKLAIGA